MHFLIYGFFTLSLRRIITQSCRLFTANMKTKSVPNEYGRRVREIEHASFTPLVFTTGGGMAPEAMVFFKRLASLLSEKRSESFACVLGWMRCTISVLFLRSALMCKRGTRTKTKKISCDAISEAVAGSHLKY